MSVFDYRVHYDNEGLPDDIMWMVLNTRKSLLQFSDILSLDFQIRTFNKIGLPYSGIECIPMNTKLI